MRWLQPEFWQWLSWDFRVWFNAAPAVGFIANTFIKMEEIRLTRKQKIGRWLIILASIPALIIIVFLFSVLFNGIYSLANGGKFFSQPDNMGGSQFLYEVLQNFILFFSVLLWTWIFWMKIQKNSFVSIGFYRNAGWIKEIILGFVAGIGLLGSVFLVLLATGNIQINSIEFHPASLATNLIVFLFVGFNEEMITRGYLMGSIKKLSNKVFALVLVAVLFSLMHIFNDNFSLVPFLNIFLAGILLGVVYVYTERLWFAISLHFTWNFFQGPVFGSQVSGNVTDGTLIHLTKTGNSLITGGDFGFEGSLLMTFLMIAAIFIIGFHYYKRQNKKAETQF